MVSPGRIAGGVSPVTRSPAPVTPLKVAVTPPPPPAQANRYRPCRSRPLPAHPGEDDVRAAVAALAKQAARATRPLRPGGVQLPLVVDDDGAESSRRSIPSGGGTSSDPVRLLTEAAPAGLERPASHPELVEQASPPWPTSWTRPTRHARAARGLPVRRVRRHLAPDLLRGWVCSPATSSRRPPTRPFRWWHRPLVPHGTSTSDSTPRATSTSTGCKPTPTGLRVCPSPMVTAAPPRPRAR